MIIWWGLLMLLGGSMYGQQGVHAGMVRVQGTFALGVLNGSEETRSYIYGEAEGMLDDHVGFNGGLWAQVGSSKDEYSEAEAIGRGDVLVHSLFAGPQYHFLPGRAIDVYVGLQPGLHLVSQPAVELDGEPLDAGSHLVPGASVNTGVAWYGSFFHLFGQMRGVWGEYVSGPRRYGISEVRVCFGLGFNFN